MIHYDFDYEEDKDEALLIRIARWVVFTSYLAVAAIAVIGILRGF